MSSGIQAAADASAIEPPGDAVADARRSDRRAEPLPRPRVALSGHLRRARRGGRGSQQPDDARPEAAPAERRPDRHVEHAGDVAGQVDPAVPGEPATDSSRRPSRWSADARGTLRAGQDRRGPLYSGVSSSRRDASINCRADRRRPAPPSTAATIRVRSRRPPAQPRRHPGQARRRSSGHRGRRRGRARPAQGLGRDRRTETAVWRGCWLVANVQVSGPSRITAPPAASAPVMNHWVCRRSQSAMPTAPLSVAS